MEAHEVVLRFHRHGKRYIGHETRSHRILIFVTWNATHFLGTLVLPALQIVGETRGVYFGASRVPITPACASDGGSDQHSMSAVVSRGRSVLQPGNERSRFCLQPLW